MLKGIRGFDRGIFFIFLFIRVSQHWIFGHFFLSIVSEEVVKNQVVKNPNKKGTEEKSDDENF